MAMSTLEDRIKSAFEPYRFTGDVKRTQLERPIVGRGKRRRWGALVAAVAAAAALAVVLPSVSSDGVGGADPAAAGVLRRLSTIALHEAVEASPQPGQFIYQETRQQQLSAFVSGQTGISFRYWLSTRDQNWIGTDGSGMSQGRSGQPRFLTDQDREAYERYVSLGVHEDGASFDWGRQSYSHRYDTGELTYFDFTGLPTDVEVLRGMLERREIIGGPPGDWETFNLAADTLTWSYAPPELRAALFEVMADLPGVELLGRTEDSMGRAGIALGYTHDDQQQQIVLERGTARVLERRWVSVSGDAEPPAPDEVCTPEGACGASEMWIPGPPGTTNAATTYMTYGAVVDGLGQTPRG